MRAPEATMDAPIRTLFERIAESSSQATPDLEAIGSALVDVATNLDYLLGWIERLGDINGLLPIHAPERGPRLFIVHRTSGNISPVHDHGTWVGACPVIGLETHRRYRVNLEAGAAHPELAEERFLAPRELVTMLPPDDQHAHGHTLGHGSPAYVLILTGDDQNLYTRNEWDLATGRHRVLVPGDRGRWLDSEPMP